MQAAHGPANAARELTSSEGKKLAKKAASGASGKAPRVKKAASASGGPEWLSAAAVLAQADVVPAAPAACRDRATARPAATALRGASSPDSGSGEIATTHAGADGGAQSSCASGRPVVAGNSLTPAGEAAPGRTSTQPPGSELTRNPAMGGAAEQVQVLLATAQANPAMFALLQQQWNAIAANGAAAGATASSGGHPTSAASASLPASERPGASGLPASGATAVAAPNAPAHAPAPSQAQTGVIGGAPNVADTSCPPGSRAAGVETDVRVRPFELSRHGALLARKLSPAWRPQRAKTLLRQRMRTSLATVANDCALTWALAASV